MVGAYQLESFDDVCSRLADLYDEDDVDLLPRDKEPEAWSVTVDIKTLKRMNSRDIKRQDHIWGSSCRGHIIQMTHDGECDMLKYIYVLKLKCQHEGEALL